MNHYQPRVLLEALLPGGESDALAGWTIRAGFADTRFGLALFAEGPQGLCHLSFLELGKKKAAWDALVSAWPGEHVTRDDHYAAALAAGIFRKEGAERGAPEVRAFVRGTEFQVKVWRALLEIPIGVLVSYGELAKSIGHPAATRATGTAVGKNPLAWVIPCHRVVRQSGEIGKYRWGSERKRAMIDWEATQTGMRVKLKVQLPAK